MCVCVYFTECQVLFAEVGPSAITECFDIFYNVIQYVALYGCHSNYFCSLLLLMQSFYKYISKSTRILLEYYY